MNKQKYRTSDGGMGCEKNTAEKHDGPGVGRGEGRELTGSNQQVVDVVLISQSYYDPYVRLCFCRKTDIT